MLTGHEELTRPRVLAAVEDLETRGASGVLEVTGDPSGCIYLDSGQITFARASWAPGLAARVHGIGPLPAAIAELASRGTDDAALAAHLVQYGYLTMAALHELIRSIVVDAFLVLTIPLAVDCPVTAIRFTSTPTYWTELFPRLRIGAVRQESVVRAERMAGYGLAPTTSVALRDLRHPSAVLTPRQWAVARQLGRHACARDLALRYGAALADTMESLGSLVQVGLCAPVRVTDRRQSHQQQQQRVGPGQSPSADILRQVLSGLRKLS